LWIWYCGVKYIRAHLSANRATHRATHGYKSMPMPYPRLIGSPVGMTHGSKQRPILCPFGSGAHGRACPWVKLPGLLTSGAPSAPTRPLAKLAGRQAGRAELAQTLPHKSPADSKQSRPQSVHHHPALAPGRATQTAARRGKGSGGLGAKTNLSRHRHHRPPRHLAVVSLSLRSSRAWEGRPALLPAARRKGKETLAALDLRAGAPIRAASPPIRRSCGLKWRRTAPTPSSRSS
jgi:hypothetical protein